MIQFGDQFRKSNSVKRMKNAKKNVVLELHSSISGPVRVYMGVYSHTKHTKHTKYTPHIYLWEK